MLESETQVAGLVLLARVRGNRGHGGRDECRFGGGRQGWGGDG